MRERFLKGKTKRRALTYSILVLYRALARFVSVEIKCLLFPFLWNHVLCGSWAESNITEGKLGLANHRFVLYDITHQPWNRGLNKVNESITINFNGVTVSSRTFSHISSYIGGTRVLWFNTEWANYLSVLQKIKRKIKRIWSSWQGQEQLRSCHLYGMRLQSRFEFLQTIFQDKVNMKRLPEPLDMNQKTENPWRDLFVWAVLQNRHKMANYFWAMVSFQLQPLQVKYWHASNIWDVICSASQLRWQTGLFLKYDMWHLQGLSSPCGSCQQRPGGLRAKEGRAGVNQHSVKCCWSTSAAELALLFLAAGDSLLAVSGFVPSTIGQLFGF